MRALIELLIQHGTFLVFAVTLAARVGVPVPAAPLLVVAGGLASANQLSWLAVLGVSIVANVLGDYLWFRAGRRFGHRVMRLLCRISLSPDSCVRQSESLISRWGGSSLVAAKFLPGISVVAAPMAGALGMSTLRFAGYDVLAGALWTGVFLALGMLLSEQIQQILDVLANAGLVAGTALALVLAALVLRRWWRRRVFLRGTAGAARITADEAVAMARTGPAPVFIDVRAESSRSIDTRRIAGAISLEAFLSRHAQEPGLPRDQHLVLYCNCPNDVSALLAAQTLAGQGFTRARALTGGLEGWAKAGRAMAEA